MNVQSDFSAVNNAAAAPDPTDTLTLVAASILTFDIYILQGNNIGIK